MVSCSEDSNLVLFDATSGTVLQSLDMGASLALSLTWYVSGRACEFRLTHAHAGLHACAQARTLVGTVHEGPRTEQGLHDRGPDEMSMLVATGGKRVKVTCVSHCVKMLHVPLARHKTSLTHLHAGANSHT